MPLLSRRAVIRYGLSLSAGFAAPAGAQTDLLASLTLTTGFPPGGNGDYICRALAEQLKGTFATNVVVENRTGAGGQIAIAAMKTRPGDGSVALNTVGSTLSLYPHTYKSLQYDPFKDLVPISLVCRFDAAFGVGPKVPASVVTIKDLIKWMAADKDHGVFGTGGAGSSVHLAGALLGKEAGLPLSHAAYRGSLPAIQDLIGGQIGLVVAPVGEFLPHLQGGRVRVLATAGAERNRFTPNVPTLSEQGFPQIEAPDWYGIFASSATSDADAQALSTAIRTVLSKPTVVSGLARMGMVPEACTPAELKTQLRRDYEYWGAVVRKVGFTAEG